MRLLKWFWHRVVCENCGRSKLGSQEHIPILDEPGRCWDVFAPGAAEKVGRGDSE